MSRKKRALLGPNGKPLDVEKYRPKPPEPDTVTHTMTLDLSQWARHFYLGLDSGLGSYGHRPRRGRITNDADEPTLHAATTRDLAAIHDALPADWRGKAEIEPVPPELTDTYDAAFAPAVRNCPHDNSHSTMYARSERQCDDCGRYFIRKPGLFGW